MTELGEGASPPAPKKEQEEHWLEVNYCYPDGLPVEGNYMATDGDGLQYRGTLNDQGGLCLNNLPAGAVEVELIRPVEDAELKNIRQKVKSILDMLLAEKRQETAEVETRLAQRSALGQAGEIAGAAGEGLWNGAVGLIEFIWDTAKTIAEIQQYLSPLTRLNNLLESSYQSYKSGSLTEEKWLQSISDNMAQKELDDLSLVLGFDPRKFDPALVAEA
jgi:hypothetical protein